MKKTITLVLAVMLLSAVFTMYYSLDANAVKSKGTPSNSFGQKNAKKICGDQLCSTYPGGYNAFKNMTYSSEKKSIESKSELMTEIKQSPKTTPNKSPYKFEGGYPAAGTSKLAYDASDLRRAIETYKFFFPTVSTEALMQQMPGGEKPNTVWVKMATAPRHQIPTGNSDTPYAFGPLDLKAEGPMVIELPPGTFIGFVNDHNMRWVLDMGTIGPDKGEGGKHLILPPDYQGDVPAGYYVGQSKTWKVLFAIRSLSAEGDSVKALKALDDVKIYPLAKAGEPVTFHFIDVTDKAVPLKLLAWENNLDYWQQLNSVIQAETAPEEFRPMLGMLASLGIEMGKPFNPDEHAKQILEEAAHIALAEMRINSYDNRRPEVVVWQDRNWEWVPMRQLSNVTKDYGIPAFLDLEATDHWSFQAYGASTSMGKREIGSGSIYFAGFRDNTGAHLDGSKTYNLKVPGPVPGKLFWSATVYDVDTRSEISTDQERAAVRSLYEKPQPNPDGSFDIFFGPKAPAGKEDQWVKTIPGKGWFIYFRIYGPQAPAFDGTWKLNNIAEMK